MAGAKAGCRPGLRLRLWLGAAALALLAMAAAGIAVFGLVRIERHAAEAVAAQTRLEGWAGLNMRINDWMLVRLIGGGAGDGAAVHAGLLALDGLIRADVAAAPDQAEADRRARNALALGKLRGFFRQLEGAMARTGPQVEPALAFYAAQGPQLIASQIDQEARRRDQALQAMERLRPPLLWAALGLGLAAPLVLFALYRLTMRPLFRRLAEATAAAGSLASGGAEGVAEGHDELGLMLARLRLTSARLDRQRARLIAGHLALEQTVAARTAELRAANARLQRIDASRRRFFADVSHELRTPLTVILGEAELGAMSPDPATRSGFETIGTRAKRLVRRVEDMLRIARSESGELELAVERVDLREIVALALADLTPVLRRAGVTVEVDLPALVLRGDAEWLRQVFAGIFENAAKYAGQGAHVDLGAAVDGDMVTITITDTGPGLAPDRLEAVFDRFARAPEGIALTAGQGFGLGLALARWVVEASGGSLVALPSTGGLHLRLVLPLWEVG